MPSNRRLIRHPGLEPLWRSIEREHRSKQFAALLATVTGLAVSLFTLRAGWVVWPFAGMIATTLALYWLFRLLSNQPLAAWREDLRDYPEQFAWVYGEVTEHMPFGLNFMRSGILYLVEVDGTSHSFRLRPDRLLLVSKTLNRLLPHAEFGYTPERELRYRGENTSRPKYPPTE